MMAETQVYWGSDTGMVLGPYTRDGIQQHLRAKQTLIENHSASDIFQIDATSLEDAQAKLAALPEMRRKRTSATTRARTGR